MVRVGPFLLLGRYCNVTCLGKNLLCFSSTGFIVLLFSLFWVREEERGGEGVVTLLECLFWLVILFAFEKTVAVHGICSAFGGLQPAIALTALCCMCNREEGAVVHH